KPGQYQQHPSTRGRGPLGPRRRLQTPMRIGPGTRGRRAVAVRSWPCTTGKKERAHDSRQETRSTCADRIQPLRPSRPLFSSLSDPSHGGTFMAIGVVSLTLAVLVANGPGGVQAPDSAADLLVLRDGKVLLGQVVEPSPRGAVVVV